MKRFGLTFMFVLLSTILTFAATSVYSENIFDRYFMDNTMRIDYYHSGDNKTEEITLDKVYKYKGWAGSLVNLLDTANLGKYMVKIYDESGKNLLFSRSFNSIFEEYQTTNKAISGERRTYHETALIPFPKEKVIFSFMSRDKNSELKEIYRHVIDPNDTYIINNQSNSYTEVIPVKDSGDPHKKVDIVIAADGYTKTEKDKFVSDCRKLIKTFFNHEIFLKNKNKFNFWAVFRPSSESGCSEPSFGSFRNNALGSSFDSLGSERYLLTEHNKELHDTISKTPCDTIMILVNTRRYGGGGIYGFYATTISDNHWTNYVSVHEFGHSFAGLADEYYTSSVEYNDFHPVDREPLAENITALLDPGNLKWKSLVKSGTEIPTPWNKEKFDNEDMKYQSVRDKLYKELAEKKKSGAPKEEIRKIEAMQDKISIERATETNNLLMNDKYASIVGAFEGAGYRTKGLYRSMVDCIMFSKGEKPFCKVCQEAIEKRIRFFSE